MIRIRDLSLTLSQDMGDLIRLAARRLHVSEGDIGRLLVRKKSIDARKKDETGNDLYGGRITAAVEKMEASERSGLTPDRVADAMMKLLGRKRLPPHKIVGAGNECLGLLYRLLPTGAMLRLLGKLYG